MVANGWANLVPFRDSDFKNGSVTIDLEYREAGFALACGLFLLWWAWFLYFLKKKNPLGHCNQVGRNSKSTFAKD
jgi:hypothetical protein